MINISLAGPGEQSALINFLASVYGEKLRTLATQYVGCMFSQDFRRPNFLVARDDTKIIGTAAFSEELFTIGTWGISWVCVAEERRQQGLGRRLVESCLKEIRQRQFLPASVILATYPNQTTLYEQAGFKVSGIDHEGGAFMTLVLHEP